MEFTFRLQTAARKNSATDFTNDIKLITLIVTLRIPAEKYNWKNQTTGQYLFEIFFVNLQFCVQAEFSVKSSGGRNKHKKKDSQVKLKIKRMNSKSATDLVREAKLQTENLTPQQVESELKSEKRCPHRHS
ncbi:MAG: hypothetical protein UZ10_BCD003001535 [Bacteroidetes bacterium OLB10]|nr:MAG: hypothetical protein UZ10_BCD003001535 [Bacteroidetes bacterium OLB10]